MSHNNFWLQMPSHALKVIEDNTHFRSYKKGALVYAAGEDPIGIYSLRSGLVGLMMISNKGAEHLLRLFAANQFFGHRTLFAGERYYGQAVCLEPSEIGLVPLRVIEEILARFPEVSRLIIATLAQELGQAELLRLQIADDEVIQRIASAIVYLKEVHPEHLWTRNEIANYCASTGPTVIRGLGNLEEKGFIAQQGREITIIDRAGLIRVAQGESD